MDLKSMVSDGWGDNVRQTNLSDMLNLTIEDIYQHEDEAILFKMNNGLVYQMFHMQDCCESVLITDVCGDLNDLKGGKVLSFEERSGETDTDYGSETWTFYDIQTTKGFVNIRWLGESNGYYSESVDFCIIKQPA